jgi:hypothetical protein
MVTVVVIQHRLCFPCLGINLDEFARFALPRLLVLISIRYNVHGLLVYNAAVDVVCWRFGRDLAESVGVSVEDVLPIVRCRGR